VLLPTALAGNAFSNSANKSLHYSGFYADVGVGVVNTQINNNSQFTWNMPNFPPTGYGTTLSQRSSAITTPLFGHFGLGYQLIRHHFSLSVSPFLELASIDVNNSSDFHETLLVNFINFQQIHIHWTTTLGIDLRPGWMVTPDALLYLVFGADWQDINVQNSGHGSGTDPRFGEATPNISQRKIATGVRYGFGLQSWLARHWAIYFNYVYTHYPNRTLNIINVPTGGTIANNTIALTSQLRVFSTNKILVGVHYYFLRAHTMIPWGNFAPRFSWRGFLLGFQAGVLINQYWHRGTFTRLITSGVNPEINFLLPRAQMGKTGPSGSLNIGYGLPWHRFYVELAAAFNLASHQGRDQALDRVETGSAPEFFQQNQLTLRRAEWTIDFLPGVLVTSQTLLHLRFGAAFNRATLTTLSRSVSAGAFIIIPLSQRKNVTGLRLGLGIKQAVTSRINLTANYIFTDYGYISVSGAQSVGVNAALTTFSRLYMNTQGFLLGFEYRF